MSIKLSFVAVILLLFSFDMVAAQSESELITKLTKNNSKTWIFEKIVTTMGSKCIQGEKWVFSKDNKISKFKCESGEWLIQQFTWSLKKESALDVSLKVGETTYTLTFLPRLPRSTRDRMRLRSKAVTINQATEDRLFST